MADLDDDDDEEQEEVAKTKPGGGSEGAPGDADGGTAAVATDGAEEWVLSDNIDWSSH